MEEYAVLVIGAGASREYDLPLGSELRSEISRLFDFSFERSQYPTKGDRLLFDALALYQEDFPRQVNRLNELVRAGHLVRDTLHQAPSIDQFIFNRSSDRNIEIVGKLAIARSILLAEGKSKLNLGYEDTYSSPRCGFPDWRVLDTWLPAFFNLLIDRCAGLDAVADRLARVKVISFNYDRVFKHYLYHALVNYFPDSRGKIQGVVEGLDVVHPYGSLGKLDWEDDRYGVGFGKPVNAKTLVNVAKQIKTFNESIGEELRDSARAMLQGARTVMFLGFGYHQQNLELLQTQIGPMARVFGSARGFSDFDKGEIASEIVSRFDVKAENVHLYDGNCSGIFQHYSRALRLVGF